MNDTLPLWFAVPAIIAALYGWIVLEFRASARYWSERDAKDPVLVAGTRSANRYPRSCGGAR